MKVIIDVAFKEGDDASAAIEALKNEFGLGNGVLRIAFLEDGISDGAYVFMDEFDETQNDEESGLLLQYEGFLRGWKARIRE